MKYRFLAALLFASTAHASTEVGPSSGSGMAVGGAVTGGVISGIYFGGTSGALAQDATNFIWDDTNNRLGLGGTPSNQFHIQNAASSGTVFVLQSSVSTTGNMITIQRNGGGTGRGILIQNSGTTTGNSIEVQNLNATATVKGLQITQTGLGGGLTASTANASSSAIMVGGITAGAGQGVYGEVNGTGTGTAVAAVRVSTSGRALAIVSGSTASYVAFNAQQTPSFTSYELTLPNAQGAANTAMLNNGSGVLTWTSVLSGSNWQDATSAGSATCSKACTAGVATGGGCTNTVAIALQKSYQSGGNTWNCEYATAVGDCTAQVNCAAN